MPVRRQGGDYLVLRSFPEWRRRRRQLLDCQKIAFRRHSKTAEMIAVLHQPFGAICPEKDEAPPEII